MPLWYMGDYPIADNLNVASVGYVNSLSGQNLSSSAVKQRIQDRFALANYALNSWADGIINSTTSGQAFARKNDLTQGLLSKVPILGNNTDGTQVLSRANGPVALDSSGKVSPSIIKGILSTQRYPQMAWTPSSYPSAFSAANESTYTTIPVNTSLTSYKVFVTGTVNAKTSVDGEYPIIRVRAGSSSGPIVAVGYGLSENYKGGSVTALSTAALPLGGGMVQPALGSASYTYSIPSWCNKIDVILMGGGGGGINGVAVSSGTGGDSGTWYTTTLTKGSEIPAGTTFLSGTIGAGASGAAPYRGNDGGTTTCVVPGYSSFSAKGGSTGGNRGSPLYKGIGPGNRVYNDITYIGGTDVTTAGANGNAPGGGGAGGKAALTGNDGGRGADGAAFFYAYLADDNNYAQIGIIPTPMDAQAVLTGATTLFVNVARSGSSSVVATDSVGPQISVMAVPA